MNPSEPSTPTAPRSDPADEQPARRWAAWTTRQVFLGLFGLSLVVQAFIYGVVTSKPVIRSDGLGYQAYLPAVVVDRDLSFETYGRREFPEGIPYWTGIHPGPRGHVVKYPLGVALLQFPFFVVAHGVAQLAGSQSVYAPPYQIAAAVAGAWYFAWGGVFTWLLLRRTFPAHIALLGLLLTIFGTNVLHYATYDAAFSHVYSFFLVSGLLVVGADLPRATTGRWLATGLLAGLTIVTRPTNGLFLLLVAADWYARTGPWRESLKQLRDPRNAVSIAALAAAAPLGLQCLYWRLATGAWIYHPYASEGFNFLAPAGLRVLFSFEKGWLVYVPLVALAVAGWIAARRQLSPDARVVLVFMALNIWVIASWHDWGYGGSFSMRPLVESSPLVALGVTGLLGWAWPHDWARRLCLTLGLLCTVYTLILMAGYWTRTLPYIMATPQDILRCLTFSWLRH